MNRYLKFGVEVVAAILTAVAAALLGDGRIDYSEWVNVLIVGLGAVAVLGAGNFPAGVWAHMKTIVAAVTAGAVLLHSLLGDGVTTAEWFQVAAAVLGALTVAAVKGPVVQPDAVLRR